MFIFQQHHRAQIQRVNICKAIHLILLISLAVGVSIARAAVIQDDQLAVIYEPPLKSAASDVVSIYPRVKDELEALFDWRLDVRPRVVLINNSRNFRQMARHSLYVAFAVPEKNLVVIDYSKMATRPFTLATTLKHELCHLLLHRYIDRANLPRWLDEGVCQWASDGLADIIMSQGPSLLYSAVLADRLIPLSQLSAGFPNDRRELMLAYEQSKSMVDYISGEYGKNTIIDILNHLKNGDPLDRAMEKRLSLSPDELEAQWRRHLKTGPSWIVFLANHIYSILFFAAAIITIAGFIRLVIRKRAYHDEDDDED
jgi:hypothetical protein